MSDSRDRGLHSYYGGAGGYGYSQGGGGGGYGYNQGGGGYGGGYGGYPPVAYPPPPHQAFYPPVQNHSGLGAVMGYGAGHLMTPQGHGHGHGHAHGGYVAHGGHYGGGYGQHHGKFKHGKHGGFGKWK